MADKTRVLIVDDEVAIGNMLAACCDMWGLEPVVATGPSEALDIVAEHPPDLVISDFMMPEMDGAELLRRLRANAATRSASLILISAVSDAARHAPPADRFVPKPLDLTELEAVIRQVLASRARK